MVSTASFRGHFKYSYAHIYWVNAEYLFVAERSTMVIFFIFHFTYKQQKAAFTQYTML